MTDGEALFRAVCAAPWDDLPRLVYADWLDEHGHADHAAFIRFQCEFPQWDSSHPRFRELMDREDAFDDVKAALTAGLPRPRGVGWVETWFSRGFHHWAEFHSTKAFAAHADAVLAAAPVDHLTVGRVTPATAARVLGSASLSRLKWFLLKP